MSADKIVTLCRHHETNKYNRNIASPQSKLAATWHKNKSSARNINVVFDTGMTSHQSCQKHLLYYRRKHVASVRLCLTQKPTTRLMHSRYIDYTNGLLRGIPDCLISRLQSVGNVAAWLVVCYRWDHIT